MHRESFLLKTADDRSIECFLFEPVYSRTVTTVIFAPGITSHVRDYQPLLEPLAEELRVLAFNLPGHGKSTGLYEPGSLASCVADLVAAERRDVVCAGHSLGGGIAAAACRELPAVCGAYLLNPYVGQACVTDAGYGAMLATRVASRVFGRGADALARLFVKGFNNVRPVRDYAALWRIQSESLMTDKPVSYLLAEKDEIMVGDNPYRYDFVRSMLCKLFPRGYDRSFLARGLNHCLNTGQKDWAPFLKPEPGKDSDALLTNMRDFCTLVVANRHHSRALDKKA